jgi:Zn-dependent peptidase ImmA (M78 family)
MRFPKSFDIFGMKVKIVFSSLMNHVAGLYDPDKKVMTINEAHETDHELLHTVLHECGHALFFRVSINQAISFETHEYIVNNYATMLLENFDIKPKLKRK